MRGHAAVIPWSASRLRILTTPWLQSFLIGDAITGDCPRERAHLTRARCRSAPLARKRKLLHELRDTRVDQPLEIRAGHTRCPCSARGDAMRQTTFTIAALVAMLGAPHAPAWAPQQAGGTVLAWGFNFDGELGNGTSGYFTESSTPVPVSGLSGVVTVAGGYDHSLALRSDGTVWAWGSNSFGQLGNGTTTNSPTPVPVSGLSGVVAVAGGMDHSLALRSDGTVWAWGSNYWGQLGNGTTTDSLTPVQVGGLSGVVDVAGKRQKSLALKSDGTCGRGVTAPAFQAARRLCA
jgi:hypothetical protein